MNIYYAVIRHRSEITKQVAVQAHDKEDARYLIERLLMNNMEAILDDQIRDISDRRREKERFRDFVERTNDIDYLLVTGGKYPTVVEKGWVRDRRPVERRDLRDAELI